MRAARFYALRLGLVFPPLLFCSCKQSPTASPPSKGKTQTVSAESSTPAARNYALWFDGQDDVLRTDKWFSGNPGQFTLEAWIKPAATNPAANLGYLFAHRAVGLDKAVSFDWEKFAVAVTASLSPGQTIWTDTGRAWNTSGWHHVALVGQNGRLLLYVDGRLAGQTSTTLPLDWQTAWQGSFLGGDPLPRPGPRGNFRGLLDAVRIWSIARTPDEIRSGMNRSVSPDTPGLEACWDFDEGNGPIAHDSSPHGRHAQLGLAPEAGSDDPVWIRSDCPMGSAAAAGPAGYALWLSGQGEPVRSQPMAALRGSRALTIEAWICPTSPLVAGQLFSSASSSPDVLEFALGINESGWLWAQGRVPEERMILGKDDPIRPAVWQHIALVSEDGRVLALKNGRPLSDAKPSVGPVSLSGNPLQVGGKNGSFGGAVDELRLWTLARSNQQIAESMHQSVAPDTAGLAGYWRFDEGSGRIARDLSPSAAHAQLGDVRFADTGDPLWLVSDAPLAAQSAIRSPQSLVANFALEFDGVDDFVDMGNAPELRMADAVTIEAWIKPSLIQEGERPILGKGNANGHQNAYELQLSSGTVRFMVSDGTAGCCGAQGWWPAQGKSLLDVGVWRHVAGVYDRKHVQVYLDGVQVDAMAFDRPIHDVPFSVKVGTNALFRPRFFAGQIDEVRLWNRARTAADLVATMNTPLRGDEEGLVGYWTFDDPAETGATSPSGQVAFDHSRHNHHGILGSSMDEGPNDPRWVPSDLPIAPRPEP